MTTDDILKQFGLKFEELNVSERETLDSWLQSLNEGQITTDRIREYIHNMRDAVEEELTQVKNGSDLDYLLKARLRNYMLLEAFLSTPDRAKKMLERRLAGISGKR